MKLHEISQRDGRCNAMTGRFPEPRIANTAPAMYLMQCFDVCGYCRGRIVITGWAAEDRRHSVALAHILGSVYLPCTASFCQSAGRLPSLTSCASCFSLNSSRSFALFETNPAPSTTSPLGAFTNRARCFAWSESFSQFSYGMVRATYSERCHGAKYSMFGMARG